MANPDAAGAGGNGGGGNGGGGNGGGGNGGGGNGGGGNGGGGNGGGGNGGGGRHNEFWSQVQQTRSWVGFFVVLAGAAAITGVTLWGLTKANSKDATSIVAILSSAFTAIATMITAYFGIRATANTAQATVGDTPAASGKTPAGNKSGGSK